MAIWQVRQTKANSKTFNLGTEASSSIYTVIFATQAHAQKHTKHHSLSFLLEMLAFLGSIQQDVALCYHAL